MPDKDPLGILQSSNNNSTNDGKDPLGILSVTPTQESTASSLPTQPEKPTFSTLFGNKDANIPQALPKDYTPVKTLATQYGIKEEDLSKLANATPEEAASVTGLDIGKVKELQKAYKSEQIATAATLSPLVIYDEKPSKPKLTLEQTIIKPVATATEIPFTTQKTQEQIS